MLLSVELTCLREKKGERTDTKKALASSAVGLSRGGVVEDAGHCTYPFATVAFVCGDKKKMAQWDVHLKCNLEMHKHKHTNKRVGWMCVCALCECIVFPTPIHVHPAIQKCMFSTGKQSLPRFIFLFCSRRLNALWARVRGGR